MATLNTKSSAESDPGASSPSADDSVRASRTSDHPPLPAKLPSWRPTVPGVQPRPTLHGVQPLITLRGLNAPTEHDLPVQRDTPDELIRDDIDPPRFGAPRIPADLGLELGVAEVSPGSDHGTISRRLERAARVRRMGLGVAVAFGMFSLVVAIAILFASAEPPPQATRAQATSPARAHATSTARDPALAPTEPDDTIPAPPAHDSEARDSTEPPAEESLPLPPPAPPVVNEKPEAPLREARKPSPRKPTRPSLFSQVPARPAAD